MPLNKRPLRVVRSFRGLWVSLLPLTCRSGYEVFSAMYFCTQICVLFILKSYGLEFCLETCVYELLHLSSRLSSPKPQG